MSLTVAATVFALILPVEMPDKTLIASLVLATRFKPLPVWIGVAAAFVVQCAVAVAAGGLLVLLPRRAVEAVVAVLFAVGAVVLLRSHAPAVATEAELARRPGGWRAVASSFGVLFAAEWGDVSQLATASLQARYEDPIAVFVGAWAALAGVAALAIVAGRTITRWVPLRMVQLVAAGLFTVFAVVSAAEAIRG